jgi:hypothetical protein
MSTVSTARKLTTLGRIMMQHAGQSRTGNALWQGARATAISVGHVLHLLWLQVTGFVFLTIALTAGFAFRREYLLYKAGTTGPGKAWLAGGVTIMFIWFGISSFWRANKKKK